MNTQKINQNSSPLEDAKNEPYLRNRPFLAVNILQRPAKSVKTEVKGWRDITGNVENFETPYVVDRVNAIHLRNAAIIVDVLRSECVKNQFSETPNDEVAKYYINKYQSQITEATEIWLTNQIRAKTDNNTASSVDAVYTMA